MEAFVTNIEVERGWREYIMCECAHSSLARTLSLGYHPWIQTHITRSASLKDKLLTERVIQHVLNNGVFLLQR